MILLALAGIQPVAVCSFSKQFTEPASVVTETTPEIAHTTTYALPAAKGLEIHRIKQGFRIVFQVPSACKTTLRIHDQHGATVRTLYNDLAAPARPYALRVSTKGLAPGIYYCELGCPGEPLVEKLLVLE